MHRIEDVVARDMCVGCGGCAVITRGAISVEMGDRGLFGASLAGVNGADLDAASRVCPFSDAALDEDALAEQRFGSANLDHHRHVGLVRGAFAGRLADDEKLRGSSSGGLTSWVLSRLLDEGRIDGVVHVGAGSDGRLVEYVTSSTSAEIAERRKSFYYPTTMAEVLQQVRDGEQRRYAVVGVPCFIKAARLLAHEDEALAERLEVFVGIVCGHLKSEFFAQSLAWQSGVEPGELAAVDFRVKNDQRGSNDYDFSASSVDGTTHVRRTRDLVGANWGHGTFQPEACNFCDDIFAETADVVFGDAWLPQYTQDWRGHNVVITRDEQVDELLRAGGAAGEIFLEDLPVDQVRQSQAGNVRHRIDGLAVRLADDVDAGLSVPRKRVSPDHGAVAPARLPVVRLRREMSRQSLERFREARASGDLSAYLAWASEAGRRYRRVSVPWQHRVAERYGLKLPRWVKRILGR